MATTEEKLVEKRGYKSQLTQARLKDKQIKKESKGFTPETVINAGEMIIVLGGAIIVDIIDILDLTGFGAILVRFIDIPILGALWLWRVMKHQAGPKKDPTFALLMAFLTEISPAGMIPTWTIFVIYVYVQDTKIGKKTIGKAKKISKPKKSTKK